MRKNILLKLKSNSGIADYVSALFGIFVLVFALIFVIAGVKLVNEYSTLNEFGEQLIKVAADYGRCAGSQIDDRYAQLSANTKLSPEVAFKADYQDAAKKTVQYAEEINLTLTWEAKLSVASFSLPVQMKITKTARSEQYWKRGS